MVPASSFLGHPKDCGLSANEMAVLRLALRNQLMYKRPVSDKYCFWIARMLGGNVKPFSLQVGLMTLLFLFIPNKVDAQKNQSSIPVESTVSSYLRNRVAAESDGALALSSFQKTNGYASGAGIYVIEWQAILQFQQECWKPGDMFTGYWQDFRVMLREAEGLEAVAAPSKRFDKGTTVRLGGNAMMRKTERGWRVETFEVKTAKTLGVPTGNVVSNGTSQLYIAPNGAFSYRPPTGAILSDREGQKFKIAVLQKYDGINTSILIREESFVGSLDDYADRRFFSFSAESTEAGFTDFRRLSRTEFITDTKERGIKVVSQAKLDNIIVQLTVYFFAGKNGIRYLVACMVSARVRDAYDKIFDVSMKTFRTAGSN